MADTVTFLVDAVTLASGQITAIRVQRLDTLEWFNWDRDMGGWHDPPEQPKVEKGKDIYCAVYATNIGGTGNLTLRVVKVSNGTIIATKTENVPANQSFGLEFWNLTIDVAMTLRAEVTP